MAIDTSSGHKDMDYAEHARTYAGFIRLIKIVVISAVVILAGMKIFLV